MSLRSMFCLGCVSLTACVGEIGDIDDDHVLEFEGEPHTAVLLVEGLPKVAYVEVDGVRLVEGDMGYPPEMFVSPEQQQGALVSLPKAQYWPGGRIPYRFDSGVTAWMQARVLEAMNVWESNTPVKFVPKTSTDTDFVLIKQWNKSYSYAISGHQGGQQAAVIQTGLSAGTTVGLIEHELAHTMGAKHEQSRVDRDQHVIVHWENIKDGFADQFAKYTNGVLLGDYNIGSIMHYGSYSFSANGKPTLTRLDGTTFRENFNAPTKRDIAAVIKMYDQAAPKVSLASPTGSTATNPLTVEVDASDDFGLSKVEVLVDGAVFASFTTGPYSVDWTLSGEHTFAARATDLAGKVTTTAPVKVLVACSTVH